MSDTLALNHVAVGDIRELAPLIAPNSVNCIVCSPPYMGLRDYGTARWEGGDASCDHAKPSRQGDKATLGPDARNAQHDMGNMTRFGFTQHDTEVGATRNARNWFYWRPEPFPGDHYAVMPSSIPRFAIRAGCPPRVCARCGAPWVRVVEREKCARDVEAERRAAAAMTGRTDGHIPGPRGVVDRVTTLGWRAACACGPDAGTRPGVVLDPFVGSGTTVAVAVEEGRDWLAVDLDERSIRWTAERLARVQIRLPLDLAGEAAGG